MLGCPLEGWPAADIVATYGAYQLPAAYPASVPEKRRARLRPLGVHSDDTQQALALLSVCLTGWSPKAWAQALTRGDQLEAWRGTGRHFDAALEKLRQGVAAEAAGSPSAGIGAAMRSAPLGALYRDQTRKLAEVAMESSAVTHADLRATALAYAVAFAAARLVTGAPVEQVQGELPDAVAEAEDEWLYARTKWALERSGRHQLSLGLARLFADFPTTLEPLGARVLRLATPYLLPEFPPAHVNHGFTLLGGLYGLAVGLVRDVEPAAALLTVVRQGEDTDTVAAIAGGVLGARFGTSWVPKQKVVDHARIDAWADALVTRRAPPESLEALLQREAVLTAQEKAYRAFP